MGATAIADTLSEDKILIPSAYARQNHPEDCQCTNYHDPYTWNATTVGYILNRREYLGHTVLGKTTRDDDFIMHGQNGKELQMRTNCLSFTIHMKLSLIRKHMIKRRE